VNVVTERSSEAAEPRAVGGSAPVGGSGRRSPSRYAIAVAATLAAFALRVGLPRFFGPPYILFYPTVMLVAMMGGLGPGLLATALSTALALIWILPVERHFQPMTIRDVTSVAVFAGMGLAMSVVAHLYRRARRRVAEHEKNRALRESEERFRRREQEVLRRYELLAANCHDIILFVRGSDGRILEANAAATAAYGYGREELQARTIHDLRAGETRALTAHQMDEADLRGLLFDTVHRRRDGSTFPVEVSSRGTTLAGDRVLLSVIRDITERKRVEEHTLRQNAILAGMARIFRDALTVQTEAELGRVCLAVAEEATRSRFGFICKLNERTGLLDGVAISDPGWEACRLEDQSGQKQVPIGFEIRGLYGSVVRDGRGFYTNAPASHPDNIGTPPGHPPLEAFLGVPLTQGGKTVGMLALGNREGGYGPHDLEGAEAVAAATVQAFLSKRREEALRAANESLTEADRRKNEFIGMLSHELRNPLAPIRNSIYLLDRASPGSEQAVRAKEVIRRQAEHLARLVDDLLDVTRISRGKIELQRARIDLCDVVRKSCDDHRTLFDGRDLGLRVEGSGPKWIEADATRVSQIVGNLLQNAAKFGRRGGAVTVSMDSANGQVELRVRDDGIGISPDLLPRLFEPFVQGDGSLARTKGGLGLGLALVKGLAELHGGSVRVRSEGNGRGAEFVVTLPLATQPREEPASPPPGGATGALDLLVVEDNADAAESLAEVLRTEGHRVQVAMDGRTGLAKARALRPDVVLCDIGLPDMDGYEVARALRADAALGAARLIALSGYALPEDQRLAAEAGFDLHLAKPPSLEALFASLSGEKKS